MERFWRSCLILGLTAATAGCGPRPSLTLLQAAPAEAAEPMINPRGEATVLTATWDSSARVMRVGAVDAASGSPAPDWEPLVLKDAGRNIAGSAFSADGAGMARLSGTAARGS